MHQRRVATRFWQSVVAVSRWTRNRVGVVHMPGQQTDVFHSAVVPGHSAPSFGVASGPVRIVVLVGEGCGKEQVRFVVPPVVCSFAFVSFESGMFLQSSVRFFGRMAPPPHKVVLESQHFSGFVEQLVIFQVACAICFKSQGV